jgi:HK97 family phage portal protein
MVDLRHTLARVQDWLGTSPAPTLPPDPGVAEKAMQGTPVASAGDNGIRNNAGTPVNTMPGVIGISPATNLALSSAAFWACCRLIANSIASLPADVFRTTTRGKEPALDHPLYQMLTRAPNPQMTTQQWLQPTLMSLLIYGNGFTWVDRIGDEIVGVWPLNPSRVQVVLNLDGTFSYYYSDLRGRLNILDDSQIIHFRLFTLDGYFGLPVLVYHRMQVEFQAASNLYALTLYQNGGQPTGVLEYPGVLKENQVNRIRDSWKNIHGGPSNAGNVAILEEGAKYTPISIPLEQLQYIEEQKFSVEQIARIFGVPPHLIGAMDKPTYASVEQQSIEFVRYTILPYVRNLEQSIDKALLNGSGGYSYRMNLNAFERGDINSRYRSYATGRQWGWLSANDVRTFEDMNTIDGGDDYLTPLNMVAVPLDGDVQPQQQEP